MTFLRQPGRVAHVVLRRADTGHLTRDRRAVFSYPARGRSHLGAHHRRSLGRLGDLGGRARHELRERTYLCAHLRGNRLLIDGHVRVKRARTVVDLLRHLVQRVRERGQALSGLYVRLQGARARVNLLMQPARGDKKPVHRTVEPVAVLPPDTRSVQVVGLRFLLPQPLEKLGKAHAITGSCPGRKRLRGCASPGVQGLQASRRASPVAP